MFKSVNDFAGGADSLRAILEVCRLSGFDPRYRRCEKLIFGDPWALVFAYENGEFVTVVWGGDVCYYSLSAAVMLRGWAAMLG